MIWIRVLGGVLFCLLLIYYFTVVAQAMGVLSMTDEEISIKGLIPFYYWTRLPSSDKPNKKKKQQTLKN